LRLYSRGGRDGI